MTHSFVFVRHGRTDWSMADLTKGPGDLPLNEAGRSDAHGAGEVVSGLRAGESWILSSELTRARETAQIIGEMVGSSVIVFPDLQERYFGDFSVAGPSEPPIDAEKEPDFEARVRKAFSEIFKQAEFSTKTTVIVSHSLVFKHLSLWLTGKKESINYGEAYIFSKEATAEKWLLEKLARDRMGSGE